MRRASRIPTINPVVDAQYLAELAQLTEAFGITHTGVASAAVLTRAREAIDHRLSNDLTDGMQFTFRNPARSTDPGRAVAGAQSVFVAARPYLLAEPEQPTSLSGRIARYAWVDHYAPLREALWSVAKRLRADGFAAVPFVDDNSIVDREVAYQAGIGWFGKNANLLIPGAGSWFVLGCVVTTAPLPVNEVVVQDGCVACRRCLDACPTGAILQAGVIDAGRCLAWVLQKPGVIPRDLRAGIGNRLYGCDDCQDVCPPTVRFGYRTPAPVAESVRAWLPILELLTANDADVIERWGRWYLADRDPRWIRRNALVVLGNVGDSRDTATQQVVRDYLAHDDPMLRVHAVWAAARLGLDHLMPVTDPHPDVQLELQAAL
ncbi:MAG: tRNA epoxyqueuosine(34) reductase QueG [Ilumatobacteraceae bacterium]|nr:tRNA epoxyqueuosine(34) reductase QueG [Ilumatobacteraceae bacterium]